MTILDALDDKNLLGAAFPVSASWAAWRALLASLFALRLTEAEAALYRQHTGRASVPTNPAREAWLVVGRRGGKSRISATVAVFLACFRDYRAILAPGERGTLPVIAADRRQARTVFRYVTGLIDSTPMLAALVESRTAESVALTNGITIEVHTCSFRSVRGYTVIGAVLDEVAFYRSDDSANPDHELVNALRPAMATVPSALLLGISSPYARRGVLWDMHRRYYGQEGDPILVWQAATRDMNPTVPEQVIAEALAADPAAAGAEYLAQFRSDLEAFVSREVIDAVTVPGRVGLPRMRGATHVAFCDPSGGSSDAFALAIAHGEDRDGTRVAVLDYLAERRPPFSPDAVVAEYAEVLTVYGITRVQSDRYAGAWVVEAFAKHSVTCEQSAEPKSVLYGNLLPLLNSGRVELLDVARLHAQLLGLERRTSRAGRDLIDHLPGGHDDLANAVAGALVMHPLDVDRRFLRRRASLEAIVRDDRWHPFSRLETTLRDGVQIYAQTFDRGVPAQRAAHIALAADRQAGAVAIGYVRGLRRVSRTPLTGREGESDDGEHEEYPGDLAPVFVVEAVLRIVPEPGCDVVPEEVLELVLQIHDDVGLPIQWVTTAGLFSVVARQMLSARSLVRGELSAERMAQGYEELRAAIYDGRLEAYAHPPLLEALAALEVNEETGRIEAAPVDGARARNPATELTDAVAGVVYVLAIRRDSWGPPRSRPRNLQRPRGLHRPSAIR